VADARSPAEISPQATRAVYTSWASTVDRTARTEPARQARLANLADKIDPHHKLSDEQRERQAKALRRAELAGFAERSAKKRRKAKQRKAAEKGGASGYSDPTNTSGCDPDASAA